MKNIGQVVLKIWAHKNYAFSSVCFNNNNNNYQTGFLQFHTINCYNIYIKMLSSTLEGAFCYSFGVSTLVVICPYLVICPYMVMCTLSNMFSPNWHNKLLQHYIKMLSSMTTSAFCYLLGISMLAEKMAAVLTPFCRNNALIVHCT